MKKRFFYLLTFFLLSSSKIAFCQYDEGGLDTSFSYSDGLDSIYEISEDSTEALEYREINSGINHIDYSHNNETYSSLGGITPLPNISIKFGSTSEIINRNLFGVNVSGMFTQNTLPITTPFSEQWDWLSDLAPEMLRFPSGEFGEFTHLLHNKDGSNSLGYGFDIEEIFHYFDKTDDDNDWVSQALDVTDITQTITDAEINSWMSSEYIEKYLKYVELYNNQILLDDDGIQEDDRYINQFIKLIKKIEDDHEESGLTVKVVLCLNVTTETPSECKAIVQYLRSNSIYNCVVDGVEMGNEMGDDFHCKVLGFSDFDHYYSWLKGEVTYASDWNDLVIDNTSDPNDLYSKHDFIRQFKKNFSFTAKVGVCAAPQSTVPGAVFKSEAGTDCQEDWNSQLIAEYTDTCGIVDLFPHGGRKSFDAVIIHPYYAASNYYDIPLDQLNPEYGTTGFGYLCADYGKWTYTTYDEDLRGAFDGDADGIGIRTRFKDFIKTDYKIAYDAYNSELVFNGSSSKQLWTTEWNIKMI